MKKSILFVSIMMSLYLFADGKNEKNSLQMLNEFPLFLHDSHEDGYRAKWEELSRQLKLVVENRENNNFLINKFATSASSSFPGNAFASSIELINTFSSLITMGFVGGFPNSFDKKNKCFQCPPTQSSFDIITIYQDRHR